MVLVVKRIGPEKQQKRKGGPQQFLCLLPRAPHPQPAVQLRSSGALWMDADIQDAQPDPRSQRSSRQRSSHTWPEDLTGAEVLTAGSSHSQRSSDSRPSSHGGEEAALRERGQEVRASGPSKSSHTCPYQSTSVHPRGRGHAKPTAKEVHYSLPQRSPRSSRPARSSRPEVLTAIEVLRAEVLTAATRQPCEAVGPAGETGRLGMGVWCACRIALALPLASGKVARSFIES